MKKQFSTFTLQQDVINVLRAMNFDPAAHQALISTNKADGKPVTVLDVTNSQQRFGNTFKQNERVFKKIDDGQPSIRTNDALPLRSALYIDTMVKEVYQKETQMIQFVDANGTHAGGGQDRDKTLANMLYTVQRWDDDEEDGDTSTHDMMGRTANTNFNLSLEADLIPMPLQHIELQYTVRDKAAFESGEPNIMFDEILMRRLIQKMARQKEKMIIGGDDLVGTPFSYAGHSLYGFRDNPKSMTTTYTAWTADTAAATILTDVRNWCVPFQTNNVNAKLTLFLPTNVKSYLKADYQDTSSISILEKIEADGDIEQVIFLKYLPDDEIFLLPKDEDFYGYFNGFENTVYNWTNGDMWVKNMKIMNLKNMIFRPTENVSGGFIPCLVVSPA